MTCKPICSVTGVAWSLAAVFFHAICPPARAQSDDFAELTALAALSGKAYEVHRNHLLSRHASPWNVEAAADRSWEAGLCAWILNARLGEPERFAEADTLEPMLTRAGIWRDSYERMKLSPAGARALFVEKIWKLDQQHDVKFQAFHALVYWGGMGSKIEGPIELWKAVWEGAELRDLRLVAIHAISANDSEQARTIVANTLRSSTYDPEVKQATLTGLTVGKPSYAVALLREILPAIEEQFELVGKACGILAEMGDEAVRRDLLAMAADPARTEIVRAAALAASCREPLPEHVPVLAAALRMATSEVLQRVAVRCAWDQPVPPLRSGLHRVLAAPATPEIAYQTVLLLVQRQEAADLELLNHMIDDAQTPEELRTRIKGALRNEAWRREREEKRRNGP